MTLWSVAAYLLLPYVLVSLIWRGLRYPPYWYRWAERFGFVEPLPGQNIIWVHAVSVGEVRSSAALIRALGQKFPDYRVLVTTMTPTGSDQVHELFGDRVMHCYAPYDFPDAVWRFLNRVEPRFAVIAETEFWPSIFSACRRRNIPLMLVNARMSLISYRGYRWVGGIAREMFANADLVCAQTDVDAERLRELGVDAALIRVTGNLKFDAAIPDRLLEEAQALRQQWGRDRPVWIAASTHAGEEAQVLEAYERLKAAYPTLLLVLVPRHPERFTSVTRFCERRKRQVVQRSFSTAQLDIGTDILIGDTMGELQRLYAASDLAFIGGSLVRRGGQNLLEACAVGVPVVFGPHMFHFEEISAMALERGAACQVQDAESLAVAVGDYLGDADKRRAAGRAGVGLVAENKGALALSIELISEELSRRGMQPRAVRS